MCNHRNPYGLLLVDDHPSFREGLSMVTQSQPDLLLVGQAENAEDAVPEGRGGLYGDKKCVGRNDESRPGRQGGRRLRVGRPRYSRATAGQVRVKVEACGICHSDVMVKDGLWPGLQYPGVPGHEVAGRVDALGEGVWGVRKGDRVGVGWHGGHDFVCDHCRRGDFAMCVQRKVTGIDYDGGYAEYMVAPAEALAAIPDELPADEAGPFM